MKMTNKKFISLCLIFLVVIVVLTSTTLAWLSVGDDKDVDLELGGFTLTTKVNSSSNTLTPNQGTYVFSGLSQADHDAFDKDNTNPLISNININVTITATISGYLRIKVLDEWKVTKDYINFDRTNSEIIFKDESSFFPYTLEDGWVYDESTQYCYYTSLIEEGSTLEIPFISSCTSYTSKSNSNYIETCTVTLGLSVQAVQANRYEALWGIASIPQGGTV